MPKYRISLIQLKDRLEKQVITGIHSVSVRANLHKTFLLQLYRYRPKVRARLLGLWPWLCAGSVCNDSAAVTAYAAIVALLLYK